MNQANVENVVSRLRFNLRSKPRKFRNPKGPEGRIEKLRKTLTALIKYERIELNYPRADETRCYAERLISEALRYGPEHQKTMELADFWILEKQLVHKLFKVLVPRYKEYPTSYTKLHKAPTIYPGIPYKRAVLELKGNIYPSVEQCTPNKSMLLQNVLLDAARKEFQRQKYEEMQINMNTVHSNENNL